MCPEQVKSLLPGTQQSFGRGLISRRSQVQILPPPPKEGPDHQVRAFSRSRVTHVRKGGLIGPTTRQTADQTLPATNLGDGSDALAGLCGFRRQHNRGLELHEQLGHEDKQDRSRHARRCSPHRRSRLLLRVRRAASRWPERSRPDQRSRRTLVCRRADRLSPMWCISPLTRRLTRSTCSVSRWRVLTTVASTTPATSPRSFR